MDNTMKIIMTLILLIFSNMTLSKIIASDLPDSYEDRSSSKEENSYFKEIEARAKNEDPYAQNLMGEYYQSPQSPNRSIKQAAYWYNKAAKNGNADAALSLGQLYSAGLLNEEKKCELAVYWYEKATAKYNNPIAWANIAWQLVTCDDPTFRDAKRALHIMKEYGDYTNNVAGTIDTMAAIYAELGQFKKAISLQETAIFLLEKHGNKERIKSHKNRLNLYKHKKTFSGFAHENPEDFIE